MNVLIACEFSGIVRTAFAKRGHSAISVDLLDTELPDSTAGGYGLHIKGKIESVLRTVIITLGDGWMPDLMIAFPPCTRLTNAGARWLKVPPVGRTLDEMWKEFDLACELYIALRNARMIPRKAIENPVMHIHARRRLGFVKRQVIQPHFFGEPKFKATGFELINLPPLRRTHYMELPKAGTDEHKRWSVVHREPPGPDRWKNRSRTYLPLAEAMAEQWGALL